MLQIVKCPICEEIKSTTGKWTFRCCNREFLIEKCRIVDNSLLANRKLYSKKYILKKRKKIGYFEEMEVKEDENKC